MAGRGERGLFHHYLMGPRMKNLGKKWWKFGRINDIICGPLTAFLQVRSCATQGSNFFFLFIVKLGQLDVTRGRSAAEIYKSKFFFFKYTTLRLDMPFCCAKYVNVSIVKMKTREIERIGKVKKDNV